MPTSHLVMRMAPPEHSVWPCISVNIFSGSRRNLCRGPWRRPSVDIASIDIPLELLWQAHETKIVKNKRVLLSPHAATFTLILATPLISPSIFSMFLSKLLSLHR